MRHRQSIGLETSETCIHNMALFPSKGTERKCNSLHILPKERSNTDLAIIGKSPKIHVRIGDSILYAAKFEFHINIGIARVLIISLLPHNRGWHFGGAGDLGINRSGHVSRHANEGGASIDSTSRGLAAG